MKKNNPYVPILIREASGTEPRVFARYGASLARYTYKIYMYMRDGNAKLRFTEFGKEQQELLSGERDE
jgi:Mitochondrial ribosomal protein L51 / S25 / CI-B8 domain